MVLNRHICDRARMARDPRFDGLFFIGVMSTGIYCRPICPARAPKPENIVYFPTAAAAAQAGLRPCLRCRPEASPGSPAWSGTVATVSRALMLIRQGALNDGSLEDLALKLGVGGRHLRRLFKQHLGVSPKAFATTEKILFAKQLLGETPLPVTQIALAAGFGSIRRFNAAFRKIYGKAPSAFRGRGTAYRRSGGALYRCTLQLTYRPPLDWPRMLAFFAARAIPGVECVVDGSYQRTIRAGDCRGVISVGHVPRENALRLTARLTDSRELMPLVARVRRLFDLDANMAAIHRVLDRDAVLKPRITAHPGLRLPGAWDPFEAAVRAVAGQQISVRGARTVVGRIAAMAGELLTEDAQPGLTHYFPTASALAACGLEGVGMPGRRLDTLRTLSRAVADGKLSLSVGGDLEDFIERLTRLPGIGAWTAHYIAMRALGEPDAFPAADLGIARALEQGGQRPTPKQILLRAEGWRPWRAYAAIYLWHV